MSTLAISEGKLYTIAQILLTCANDILAVNALELDDMESETVNLLNKGFRRPSIEDLFTYIQSSSKSWTFDWTIIDNSLSSQGYLTMDRYIDIANEDKGIRICLMYAEDTGNIYFTAQACGDDDLVVGTEYVLSEQDKRTAQKAIENLIEELKKLCDASDISIEINEELQYL